MEEERDGYVGVPRVGQALALPFCLLILTSTCEIGSSLLE